MLSGLAITLALVAVVGIIGFFNPMNSHLRLADQAFAGGDYEKALQEYNNVLKESPDNWDVQAKMIEVYLAQKNYPKAQAAIENLQAKNPDKGKTLTPLLVKTQLGTVEQLRENEPFGSNTALAILKNIIKEDPANQTAKKLLAEESYWASQHNSLLNGNQVKPDQIDELLQQAISLDPKPVYKLELAKRQLDWKQPDEFAKTVSSLSQADLNDENARFLLSLLYVKLSMDSAVAGVNNNASTQSQARRTALNALDEGLRVLPDNVLLLREKIRVLAEGKDFDEARKIADQPSLTSQEKDILTNFLLNLEQQKFQKDKKEWEIKGVSISTPQIFSTDNGPVAVWAQATGDINSSVWSMDLKSGNAVKRATAGGTINNIFVTRKGQVLYSLVTNGLGQDGLYLASSSREGKLLYRTQVKSNGRNEKLSPDSRYLTFDSGRLDIIELVPAENNGLEVRYLSTIPNSEVFWFPDSSKLLVQQVATDSRSIITKIVNLQGNELLTLPAAIKYSIGGISPAGKVTISFYNSLLDNNPITLGEMDEKTGQPEALIDRGIFRATIGGYLDVLYPWNYPGTGMLYFSSFDRAERWSPDGKYLFCPGSHFGGQEGWLLEKGKPIPLPINAPGDFIGWSGNDTLVFMQRQFTQGGPGTSEKVKLIQYTVTH